MPKMNFNLLCKYSGLLIGNLQYETVAGHMPYLSHWDGLIALHPIFSMERHRLLAFARSEWNRLAKQAADEEISNGESNTLRVCFLAMLHTLGGIQQEAASLPPLHIVQAQMTRLFTLCYWHHYLDSKRFRFPEFKINQINANNRFENIGYYLDACFAIKDDYEKGVSDAVEAEKARAADAAMKALRNAWIVPVGKRKLWQWVRAHLPMKYTADAQGWMSTIFLGNEKTILDFDSEDIALLIEIILAECPPGTGILAAVRTRLDEIEKIYKDNKEAFTVDFTEFEPTLGPEGAPIQEEPLVAPKPTDFATKVEFIKANAVFYLKQRARQQSSGASQL